jgi:hypothetical protein
MRCRSAYLGTYTAAGTKITSTAARRYTVYLLYWYKSTYTAQEAGAALSMRLVRLSAPVFALLYQ